MNIPQRAFEFLEAHREGGYTGLICEIFEADGVIVQTPEFFLAFIVRSRVAHIVFACGSVRRMLEWAHANAGFFAADAVEWTREIVGKHCAVHRYDFKTLRK